MSLALHSLTRQRFPRTRLAWVVLFAALISGPAWAYDYAGHLMTGAYISRETFPSAIDGSTNNDQLIYSNRAFLDVTKIGATQYEFVTDIRDNHDFFDKVDSARLNLVGANKFRLRLLAVKDPGAVHPYFWSVGRFLPADNGVIYNDGAEVGYKLTSANSIGVFGGYRPRVNDERAVEMTATAVQVGAYQVYQSEGGAWSDGKYMSNMLVFAPKTFVYGEPTESLDFINQSMLHFGPNDRVNTYLDFTGRPDVRVEDAVLGYDHRFNPNLNATATYSRIDLTEYKNHRDIFETLSASSYQQIKTQARYKFSSQARVEGNFVYGERYLDHLRKVEVSAGPTFTKLLDGHLTESHLLGYRRNFQSNDLFSLNNLTHYSEKWEVSGDLRLQVRHQDSGENLHPVIVGLNVGHVFASSVLGSVGAEYAHDEKTTITSGLFTLGYRFGSREFTQVRDVAPPSERF